MEMFISQVLQKPLIDRLNKLVEQLVGSKEEMAKTGKTAFERSSRAEPIKNCKSAYNLATSYEVPRFSHGVTASMKIQGNDWNEDVWVRFWSDFLAVSRRENGLNSQL